MKMIMNRNLTLTSTIGHTLVFEKDVPLNVPEAMVPAVLERGGLAADGEQAKVAPSEDEIKIPEIPRGNDREKQIMSTMVAMKERNARGDFTASGLPADKVLEKLVGFKVDSKERNALWQKVLEAESVAKTGEVAVATQGKNGKVNGDN